METLTAVLNIAEIFVSAVFSARSIIWCDTDPPQYAHTTSKREMIFLFFFFEIKN